MEGIGLPAFLLGDLVLAGFNPWNELIIRPTLNMLMLLYVLSGNQLGIAIILLTIIIRLLTMPLTIKQVRQMRAMSNLQPKVKAAQEHAARPVERRHRAWLCVVLQGLIGRYL